MKPLFIITNAMLLNALAPMPYGYYYLLKIMVCVTSIKEILEIQNFEKNSLNENCILFFALLIILYNPFFAIPLGKLIWSIVNIATILLYCWYNKKTVISKIDTMTVFQSNSKVTNKEFKQNDCVSLEKQLIQLNTDFFETNKALFKYDTPPIFSNNRFIVKINNKYGYTDTNETLLIPCIYEKATPYINEHAVVQKDNDYFCIDKTGKKIDLFTYEEIAYYFDNEYFDSLDLDSISRFKDREAYDNSRKKIIEFQQNFKKPRPSEIVKKNYGETIYRNGYSIVDNKIIFKGEGVNIIDKNGYPLLAKYNNYTKISPLSSYMEQYYKIKESKNNKCNLAHEKYGIINNQGKLVLECVYDSIELYCGNFYLKRDENVGLCCDKYPNVNIIPCEFEDIDEIGSKDMFAVKKNGKYAIYTTNKYRTGKNLLTDYLYDEIGIICNEKHKVVPVRINDKMGILDENGHEILPCEYDIIDPMENEIDRKFADYSWVAQYGTKPFYPFISEESIIISKNNKYGLSLINGQVVIPCEFDNIYHFVNEYASIKYKTKWAIINKDLQLMFK